MTLAVRALMFLLFLLGGTALFAKEHIRQVQEELRRRNLYFGDIDGKPSPELSNSIKIYQARKGFSPTGMIDPVTAMSLNVDEAATADVARQWPDLPVLKSDTARQVPEERRVALQQQSLDATPAPLAPAESPGGGQDVSPAQITALVQQYLYDAETDDIDAQVSYFAYPVEYFDHGPVGPEFVRRDVTNYVKRWPQREYRLLDRVQFFASPSEDETVLEFPISFRVKNQKHTVSGKTRNMWTLKEVDGQLRIVSIREERLRE